MTSWVNDELKTLDLGDTRRDHRAKHMVDAMAQRPAGSIPQTFTTRAESEGAYRLLGSEAVEPCAIIDAVRDACVGRIAGEKTVLAIQDTTVLNFSSHPGTEGMGPIGHSNLAGFLTHAVLAVSTDGVPLGVLDHFSWARDPQASGSKHQRRKRPLEDKESERWLQSQRLIQERIPSTTTVITVADREADIFELFALERPANAELLIRACHDRCVCEAHGHLWDEVEAAPLCGTYTISLRRHPTRAPRQATMELRYRTVTISPPSNGVHDADLAPVELTAILTAEVDAPPDDEPVVWLLLTTLAVDDSDAARECLRFYTLRWLIERYFFTLKSGCKIEESQLRTQAAVECLLALYAIVAWRLLWMTYAARVDGDQPCTTAFTELEWQSLWRLKHGAAPLPSHPPRLSEAVAWTASLAGFLGRKGDGDPGVKRLWRGLMRLQDIVIGVLLIQRPQDVRNG
jgi:hypothetical protein